MCENGNDAHHSANGSVKAVMSDRCRHQPESDTLPAPHRHKFRAWFGDGANLSVITVGNLCELRKHGRQGQSTNVIILEQDADAASAPCSEQLPNAVDDDGVYATADILRPLYDASDGRAGFVSFALPPPVGNDARGVAAAARRIWHRARRPNVLVQIPATPAGIKAIFRLIAEAVSVHVTHIASHEVYCRVAEAYIAGLRQRAESGLPVSGISSFATLPTSAYDSAADEFGEMFSEAAFGDLRRLGAISQTLLRRPVIDGRSRSRRSAFLRGDEGEADEGVISSPPRKEA